MLNIIGFVILSVLTSANTTGITTNSTDISERNIFSQLIFTSTGEINFGFLSFIFLFLFMFSTPMIAYATWKGKVKMFLRQYSKLTGRHVIVMNHIQSGLFGSMITMTDVIKIEQLIRKYVTETDNKKIDLIINTFGGELFSSIRLAHLIAANPEVRIVVPKYAWSGGTFAALGANEILCNPSANFGAVDPQFGSILSTNSAKDWQDIVKRKGDRGVKDDTLAKSNTGAQLMKETQIHLEELIKDNKSINRTKFFDLVLTGNHSHANMIKPSELKEVGVNITYLTTDLPDKIVEYMKKGNVIAYRHGGLFGKRKKTIGTITIT